MTILKRSIRLVLWTILFFILSIFTLRILFPLPSIEGRPRDTAVPINSQTKLGSIRQRTAKRFPDKSGVLPLNDGVNALQSRLELIGLAQSSIDIQYYIWHSDVSGMLMLDALVQAAERGVQVRVLLDDNGISGLDSIISTLNDHDNISIRLFNPSTIRNPKLLGYLFHFRRMNRRMHNKALVVDGVATIIGGRNIGDEYFQITDGDFFVDLDVLAIGPVALDVTKAFDDYWNSQSVFSIEQLVPIHQADWESYRHAVTSARNSQAGVFIEKMSSGDVTSVARNKQKLDWVNVALVVDDPAKGVGKATTEQLMITQLSNVLGPVKSKLDLISAYFIPGEEGSNWISEQAQSGANVRVLTNAFTTTDVAMVHSGYAKYRKQLLRSDIILYELKPRSGAPLGREELNFLGLSGAGLHAKTFAVDDDRIFIGSFNFDPRSALLNCEMGFLIDSPAMAKDLSTAFDTFIPKRSYQPILSGKQLIWREVLSDDSTIRHDEEPGAAWFDNLMLTVLGWLPIEWLL